MGSRVEVAQKCVELTLEKLARNGEDENPKHREAWKRWKARDLRIRGNNSMMKLFPDKLYSEVASLAAALHRLGINSKIQIMDLGHMLPKGKEKLTGSQFSYLTAVSNLALARRYESDELFRQAEDLYLQSRIRFYGKLLSKKTGMVARDRQKEWETYREHQRASFGEDAIAILFPTKYDSGWKFETRVMNVLGRLGIHTCSKLAKFDNDELATLTVHDQVGIKIVEMIRVMRDFVVAKELYKNILNEV